MVLIKFVTRVKAGNNMGGRPEWILGHKSHANTFERDANRDFIDFFKRNLKISQIYKPLWQLCKGRIR